VLSDPNVNARLIDHFLESSVLRARLAGDDIRRVHEHAWAGEERLAAVPPISTIAHGDLNSVNLLVRKVEGTWRVVAILDWEFAFAGPIHCDVGNFLRYERKSRPRFEPWFSRGLVDGGVVLEHDWWAIARLVDLVSLCDLLARPGPDVVAAEVRELILAPVG
jgi:hypothetical protein